MKNYIGTKELEAIPMTRGAYNEYRGWIIPADENPEDLGYLVKYTSNYESWSPKEVFDEAYTLIEERVFMVPKGEPHKERVYVEFEELGIKLRGLEAFIAKNPIFKTVEAAEQVRLKKQASAMLHYWNVLAERLSNF